MKTTYTFLKTMRWAILLCFVPLVSLSMASAQTPTIFYSDITSGPATGGENSAGAYVTLYGNYFGTSGTVTMGGVQATKYVLWGSSWRWYQKLTFQVPANTPQGATTIKITNAAGTSNTVPFTVRTGNIYCVSTSGNDSNNGRFPSSCWKTIPNAKNSMVAGDISYVENGVSQTTMDDYNAALSIVTGGSSASPIALVAYPGATATIGTNSLAYGVRTPSVSGSKDYWVIAGMTLRGQDALDLVSNTGWRVIANDMSCPTGSGESACFHTDTDTYIYSYGNYVHNVGDQAGSIDKYFHAVYFSTNTNHVWVGWNEVAPNPGHSTTSGGCRAIQFYSTGGSDQFDLHVYDNLIHDSICDGLNFATVNADGGTVEAFNNVIYHTGTGPDPADGSANYTCVNTGASGNPTNKIQIYNNSFYDCGARQDSGSGAFSNNISTNLQNNVIQVVGGEVYLASGIGGGSTSGNKNVWYGAGSGPTQTTGNINADPKFISTGSYNFHLQSTSPAIDAGVTIAGLGYDHDGITRPQGSAFDIGAYEYYTGSGGGNPCDLNYDGVVNSLDVDLDISQATGETNCTNGDLDQDGLCTVIDVQRVINAALGGSCRVGP